MLKHVLHLGLHPNQPKDRVCALTHFSILEVVTSPFEQVQEVLKQIERSSLMVVTSQTTIDILEKYFSVEQKRRAHSIPVLAVGNKTKERLIQFGCLKVKQAAVEQGEGVVDLIHELKNKESIFYPHSALARPLIREAIQACGHDLIEFTLYKVVPTRKKLIKWQHFDEIYFTSASTVDSFYHLYGELPPKIQVRCLGPLTWQRYHLLTSLIT